MPFKRFVETGRVAYIADGDHKGKLVSIVDVIDQTRVLVDGPITNVPRIPVRLNQLHLTKFAIKYPFTAPTKIVRKAWADSKVLEKWDDSLWAKKLASKEKRLAMSDFDRFKLRQAKSRRNRIRREVFFNLKKVAARRGKPVKRNPGKKEWAKRKTATPKKEEIKKSKK